MRHRARAQVMGCALVAVAFLAGCNVENKDDAARRTGAPGSSSTAQRELARSNAYITAANESSGTFGKALATYRDTVSPQLAADRPLETFAVVPVQDR